MAAERPIPPFLPDTVEDFLTNVNKNPTPWVEYLRKAHEYITTAPLLLEQENPDLLERLATQDSEIAYLKEKINALKDESLRHQTIIEFQRQEADRYNDKLRRAEMDRDRAVAQAIAPVSTPALATPGSQTKDIADPPTRTTPITAPAPSEYSVRSDKLPDPDVFVGDRKDLRRFLSQVSQKLRVNANRYPTPAARLAYVSSRLSGPAYSQVLPHINSDGTCRLADYPDILGILERAYGDPNRINNARTELLQLR
jgi:TolA-binding protein